MCYHSGGCNKVGYLNPTMIRQSAVNPVLNDNHPQLVNKSRKTKKQIHDTLVSYDRDVVVVYIGRRMFEWEDRHCIMAPYHFNNHWISFMIYPKLTGFRVFDSADHDPKTYMDFMNILDRAYVYYLKLCGKGHHKRRPKMAYKTRFPYKKQAPGSMHCGYSVCSYISSGKGEYMNFPTEEPYSWENPDKSCKDRSHFEESSSLSLEVNCFASLCMSLFGRGVHTTTQRVFKPNMKILLIILGPGALRRLLTRTRRQRRRGLKH